MTSVEAAAAAAADSRTRSWVSRIARKQKKPLTMNLALATDAMRREELLEAEQMLQSLGFSPDHLQQRIPRRFLHPSKLRGIDFDCHSDAGKGFSASTCLPRCPDLF